MIGLYPLAHYPTTFDMAAWCVIAKTHGVDHVRFVIDKKIADYKYDQVTAWRRFGNINVPMCRLAGMTFSVGGAVDGRSFPYLYGDVEKCFKQFGKLEKLQSVTPLDQSGFVTITIRESFRNTFRNSNREAWDKVELTLTQRGTKVIMLEDCEDAPLRLETRMALYANAAMNLGASNGPMALCHFSEAPHLTFNWLPERPDNEPGYDLERLMVNSGFMPGSQFSFYNSKQRNVWEPDTFENIMNAYDEMMDAVRA